MLLSRVGLKLGTKLSSKSRDTQPRVKEGYKGMENRQEETRVPITPVVQQANSKTPN